ncbi:MAG: NADPH-dependent 2,4-dienoyl-CoA reductase/sulfur reductase-like enzyme [Paracoccaceae bacterium]|jgi:NADPH-dependent 2,4-dienoyl-CoA reductase/sulfur reductase-like enzyme
MDRRAFLGVAAGSVAHGAVTASQAAPITTNGKSSLSARMPVVRRLPIGVTLIAEKAAAIDPETKTVSTASGDALPNDYLVVATGLILDHDAIDGFSLDMVGENGIGGLYASSTWQAVGKFTQGGVGLLTRLATEMKCASAPPAL